MSRGKVHKLAIEIEEMADELRKHRGLFDGLVSRLDDWSRRLQYEADKNVDNTAINIEVDEHEFQEGLDGFEGLNDLTVYDRDCNYPQFSDNW